MRLLDRFSWELLTLYNPFSQRRSQLLPPRSTIDEWDRHDHSLKLQAKEEAWLWLVSRFTMNACSWNMFFLLIIWDIFQPKARLYLMPKSDDENPNLGVANWPDSSIVLKTVMMPHSFKRADLLPSPTHGSIKDLSWRRIYQYFYMNRLSSLSTGSWYLGKLFNSFTIMDERTQALFSSSYQGVMRALANPTPW